MRKFFAMLVLLLGVSVSTVVAENPEFSKGNLILGPRIGLGYFGSALGFGVSGEYGVLPMLGVVGQLGYSSYAWSSFWTSTNIMIAVGANYHFDLLKISKLDTYAGLNLGYNIQTWTYTGPGSSGVYDGTYTPFLWGFTLGGRYYFSPKLSGVLELGYGLGYLRLGVDFKL
jgi:hypothetical protein